MSDHLIAEANRHAQAINHSTHIISDGQMPQTADQNSNAKTMSKFFHFLVRNGAAFLAALWFFLAVLELVFLNRFYIAFLEFQLALVWAFVYSNELSERRLLEKQ